MRQCQYCYNNGEVNHKTNNHDDDYCSVNMMMFVKAPCEKFEALTCSPTAVVTDEMENLCESCLHAMRGCYHGKNGGVAHKCDSYCKKAKPPSFDIGEFEAKPVKQKEGKPTMLIMLEYFPKSMAALGDMFEKAHASGKYDRNSFGDVEIPDLLDAELRHVTDHVGGEIYNHKDFGHPHLVHNAGNALMALENLLNELDADK